MMKGLLLKAGERTIEDYGIEVEFSNSLKEYYDVIGCDCIEIIERSIGNRPFSLVCDEEGLLKSDPIPCCVNAYDREIIYGNVLVTGLTDEEGNLTSLTDEDVQLILNNTMRVFTTSGKNPGKKFLITLIKTIGD